MGKTGRGRLKEPSVCENHPPRQLTVTARSSLLSLLALSFLEPPVYLPYVFENALTPFNVDPVQRAFDVVKKKENREAVAGDSLG